MAVIGVHASHESHPPSALLRPVRRADRLGCGAAVCSDHLHPWTPGQGQSGFSWAWLGAALQATTPPLGTICCPFGRYHPVVVTQAAATLAELFPGRFWLAVATGQALNEHVTGRPWPDAMRAVVAAFRRGGGADKPMYLQAMVGWDPDEDRAWRQAAANWPVAVLIQPQLQTIPTPAAMAKAAGRVSPADIRGKLRVSADLRRHADWIAGDVALGFERVFLYTVSGDPERFVDVFAGAVLPACGAA